jgi:hypothetical protein
LVDYPGLSSQQQRHLPDLLRPASPLAAKFEDSTHQLWHCDTADGAMVLKLCNHQTIQKSTFWRAMNYLFQIDFPASLTYINKTYSFISEHSILNTPEFIASESSAFVLARFLSGEDVDLDSVSDQMSMQLARHVAELHTYQQPKWGAFHEPVQLASDWPKRLQQTLRALAKHHSMIPEHILERALQQAGQLDIDTFTPIMMDLRWDQMRHQQGQLSAIVDMDAFVIGPRELELVLLEYQLDKQQAEYFSEAYHDIADMPDLSAQRYCYRLLLFLMNSLGETDIEQWMSAPTSW